MFCSISRLKQTNKSMVTSAGSPFMNELTGSRWEVKGRSLDEVTPGVTKNNPLIAEREQTVDGICRSETGRSDRERSRQCYPDVLLIYQRKCLNQMFREHFPVTLIKCFSTGTQIMFYDNKGWTFLKQHSKTVFQMLLKTFP